MGADITVECQYCGHIFKLWSWQDTPPAYSACVKCKSSQRYLKAFKDTDVFGYKFSKEATSNNNIDTSSTKETEVKVEAAEESKVKEPEVAPIDPQGFSYDDYYDDGYWPGAD